MKEQNRTAHYMAEKTHTLNCVMSRIAAPSNKTVETAKPISIIKYQAPTERKSITHCSTNVKVEHVHAHYRLQNMKERSG